MSDNNNENTTREKALSQSSISNTIQSIPKPGQMRLIGGSLLAYFNAQASDAPPWYCVQEFDRYTEEKVWTQETFLASGIAAVAAQYSARTWFIDGPKRIVNATMDMFETADKGNGTVSLFSKLVTEVKTRNNGAFMGTPREGFNYEWIESQAAIAYYKPAEKALELSERGKLPPITTLEHLDSTACFRTGNPLYPVLYRDPESGRTLWLPYHMVVPIAEFPSTRVIYRGIQLSSVARILRAAQIMAGHEIYKLEKITGRSSERLIILNGLNRTEFEDYLGYAEEKADNQNLMRWMDSMVAYGVNPEKPASGSILDLKSDGGFGDIEKEMQWYITALALALLESYQTFAPLQSGGLGNSQQSIVLAEGAQGKGPALWEKTITQAMIKHRIVPRNCEFRFGEKSIRHETDKWALTNSQIDAMVKVKRDLEMPREVVYQIMADESILLNDEYLAMLGERDATDDVTVADDDQEPETVDVAPVVETPTQPEVVDTKQARKSLNALRRALKASQAETIIAEFSDEVHNAVQGYIDRVYSKRQAQGAFESAINTAWSELAPVAYEAGGGDWAEVEEDTANQLEDDTQYQIDRAVDYFSVLPDMREAESEPPDARTELYVNSLRGVYDKYKALGAGNPMLTFVLGDAKEHCEAKDNLPSCPELDGKRYSYKKWQGMEINPGVPGSGTACGGFNCQCYFVDDDGKRWGIEA